MSRKVVVRGRQENIHLEQSIRISGGVTMVTRRIVRESKELVVEKDPDGAEKRVTAASRVEDVFSRMSNVPRLGFTEPIILDLGVGRDDEDEDDDDEEYEDEEYDDADDEYDDEEDDDEYEEDDGDEEDDEYDD